MNGNAFWNFLAGIGIILGKWTDELTIAQETAIVAAWSDWTPEDVLFSLNDAHSPQRERLRDKLHAIGWANRRPIRTRVWESNWAAPSVDPDEIPMFKSMAK